MNYYIQGDAVKAEQIRAAFEGKGIRVPHHRSCGDSSLIYFSLNKEVLAVTIKALELFEGTPDYQELELPVEPIFKVGDRISWKDPDSGDPTDICRIMQLLDKEQLYMVDKEHGVSYISYTSQDYYELAPQFPQFKKGDLVCVEGALLGRVTDDHGKWYEIGGVLYNKKVVTLATQEDIDRIVGKGGNK